MSFGILSFVRSTLEILIPPSSSTIVQDISALQKAGLTFLAYFYFDFRDTNKQDLRNALASLLMQLCAQSDSYCDILSHVHQAHNDGVDKPSTETMITCFKEMLALYNKTPVYIILDALDECPNTPGAPSAREEVLDCLKDLIGLQLPNLHICVTSRPEIDILTALEPLVSYRISIHDELGQKQDIIDFVTSIVHSDRKMKEWRDVEKRVVINTLIEKADGM